MDGVDVKRLRELLEQATAVIDNKLPPATKFKELSEAPYPNEDMVLVPVRFRDARVAHEAINALPALLSEIERLSQPQPAEVVEAAYREAFLAGAQLRGDPTGDAEAWAREYWRRSEARAALAALPQPAIQQPIDVAGWALDKEDTAFLEDQARHSRTGISFDWVPSVEGEPSGFRFMRHHHIGEPCKSIKQAIRRARAALTPTGTPDA